jgi:hypothetical protein
MFCLIHQNLIRKGFIHSKDHNLNVYDFSNDRVTYRLVWTGKNWFYRRNQKVYNCRNIEVFFISFLVPSKNFPYLLGVIFLSVLILILNYLLKIS